MVSFRLYLLICIGGHFFHGAFMPVHAESPLRLGIRQIQSVNMTPQEVASYMQLLLHRLKQDSRLHVFYPLPADLAESFHAAERANTSELRAIGSRLQIAKLLAFRVGEIGETAVLRLSVFDLEKGVLQGAWQEILERPDDQAKSRALDKMIQGFLPPAPSRIPPPRWYSSWWFWTSVGIVSAAAVATTLVLTLQDSQPDPDVIITPP